MTPYEKLRAKINEILPERLVLEFGCEVEGELTYKTMGRGWISYWWTDCEKPHVGVRYGDSNETKIPIEELTILGKPLTLQDVLRALEVKRPSSFSIDTQGSLYDDSPGPHDVWINIDLTKDIKDQSEETLVAINTLLS